MKMTTIGLISTCLGALFTAQASAQWSDDPTQHMVVADGDGEQVQPKIVPTDDGGAYISWFSSMTGYDVRLQRLDAAGNEMWAHNGILIADRGFSSTQDYDLDIDSSGHAVIVFRDDRFEGVKVTAQRIAPDGSATWGADGIQFGNGADFVASPAIAATTDGFTVIGWINNSDTHLAKIGADGSVSWTTVITDPGGAGINLAAMQGGDNGSVIMSWVQFALFFDPKHLYAQKINPDGTEAWKSRVAVYDGGSLQFGNFPEFVADESGGAVFSWYDTANGLNVFAQHIASDGTELFPHNGVLASVGLGDRVSPSASYDPVSQSVYIAWIELENNQSEQGISTQRLDASGNRMWGDFGISNSPPNINSSGSINVQTMEGDMVTLWIEGGFGLAKDRVLAARQALGGNSAWDLDFIEVAADPAQRSRLSSAVSSDGAVIAGWQIGDFGVADIETHNINPDGTLGAQSCPADLTGDGELNFFDVSAFLLAFANMDSAADFTGDGKFNFFDVSAFLTDFSAGCP